MIKIKTFLLATLLLTGLVFPATAQIGEPRSNFSVGVNGGVNLNSASFTPSIKQNSLMGITGGLTARYISEKYFAMICGAQVELNISQRGWDELFEMEDENGQTIKVPGKTYTRNFLTHEQLLGGAKIQYQMSDSPNKQRGTQDSDRPYSFSLE